MVISAYFRIKIFYIVFNIETISICFPISYYCNAMMAIIIIIKILFEILRYFAQWYNFLYNIITHSNVKIYCIVI